MNSNSSGSEERPAVRTTIVGGRPPGCGKTVGAIPRGIEVLVKKAAVDSAFRTLLLEKRDAAAQTIGLDLDAAEVVMLRTAPTPQLEAIIARTRVAPGLRQAFLTGAAAVMLAALTASTSCDRSDDPGGTRGVRPDLPSTPQAEGVRVKDAERAIVPTVTPPESTTSLQDGASPEPPANDEWIVEVRPAALPVRTTVSRSFGLTAEGVPRRPRRVDLTKDDVDIIHPDEAQRKPDSAAEPAKHWDGLTFKGSVPYQVGTEGIRPDRPPRKASEQPGTGDTADSNKHQKEP